MNIADMRLVLKAGLLTLGAVGLLTAQSVLTNSDGIVRNSLCVGFDCPSGITFSDSTILLMENNTRIKFGDTSSTSSFPPNDWEIQANSNANGGANYLGFNDCGTGSNQGGCANDLVFAVEAGAPQSALYVESDGDVGMGTNNPVVDIHAVEGDTPALRLEQDGSSGFAPQTWDVAGNETNFFVRDVTNGSTLPLRIRPSAPSSSIFIDTGGDVGLGTSSPGASAHVVRSDGSAKLIVEENGGGQADRMMLELLNHDGAATIIMNNEAVANEWEFIGSNAFQINNIANAGIEFSISPTGDVTILGQCADVDGSNACDFVFDPGYELESIEEHADYMWQNSHLPAIGPTPEGKQIPFNITQRSFGMLNELEKAHIYIDQLNERLKNKEEEVEQLKQQVAEINGLKQRLAQLETLLAGSGSSR